MLSHAFARRLLTWSTPVMFACLSLLVAGVALAYVWSETTSIPVQVMGHWFVGVGAFGIKTFYIARLAALDVLEPHPEGWLGHVLPSGT